MSFYFRFESKTFVIHYSNRRHLEYLERQKEVKSRYTLKSLKKSLSSSNDVNAIITSRVSNRNFVLQSNFITATTCRAHCVSSDVAMGKSLASAIACCYPELQELRKLPLNTFPPGSLVTYFDQQQQGFIQNLVTKRQDEFFQKLTYEPIELSLPASNQHLKRHNLREIAIPKLGCGYNQLHWPKVFSFLFNCFSRSNLTITILHPTR